jgi:hypothetical protein
VTRTRARLRLAAAVAAMAMAAGVLTGCSSSAGTGASGCGTTRTAAGVPVVIKVSKGSVDCSTALSVEDTYARLVKDGDVKGNGGGAPVSVNGWTCQGYLTPQILATGDASECHSGNTQIVAVLPVATPSQAATATS